MRSNEPAQSPIRIIVFATSTIPTFGQSDNNLQVNQQFSGHAQAVMRLSSLLPANVVTANFCEVEPAVNLFLSFLQMPLTKVKTQFLLWQRFCQNHSDVVVWKRIYTLCQSNIFRAIKMQLSILETLSVSSFTTER